MDGCVFGNIFALEVTIDLLMMYISIQRFDIIQSTGQTMSLYRSAEMKYFNIHIPKEDTYDVITRVAQHSFVQFIDSAPNAFHRPYLHDHKRCEEASIKIKSMLKQIHEYKIDLPEVPTVEFVFENHRQYLKKNNMNSRSLMNKIEEMVEERFDRIENSKRAISDYNNKINDLEDYKYLLFKAREVFHSRGGEIESELSRPFIDQIQLVNVSGIIESKQLHKFTKMIFRVTKGNSILYTFNIPKEQYDSNAPARTAFICVVETAGVLITKLNRVCDSFGVTKYKLPSNSEEIFNKIKEIENAITDTKQLLVMSEKDHLTFMKELVGNGEFQCSTFDAYRIILEREAMIFQTLNLMEENGNIMSGGIWVPTQKVGLLYSLVPSFVSLREAEAATKPPTHFETNTFTAPFQQIVNTYGVPRYGEVNPALYAIPIFPFLFGVMFGDIGHGGVLLAFAIWMTRSETAKKALPDVYAIRYLLLLMGIFSFYSGWIYNEFFSIPINLFGSCYEHGGENEHGHGSEEEEAVQIEGCVYPIGFDPVWIRASNELNYFNSYKMKFAVIIGVLQMSFAIFLKMLNSRHFKNYLDLIFEWIPQQLFFFCTFGYMCILIIYKWTIPWNIEANSANAPSIIGQMIALPLKLGSTEGKPLWDIEAQESLQYNLLMISLICVPVMLIPKPLIIWLQTPKKHTPKYEAPRLHSDMSEDGELQPNTNEHIDLITPQAPSHHGGDHEEHDISEVAVHQIIETIEFVLGSISNTASYLRLWALSLAHGQLSKVFLEKTIGGGIETGNILIIVIGMYFFFNITLGVIMGMDSMECFLHALRLQWVEIQNKFFKADGWKFMPLSFIEPIQAKANDGRVFE